MATRTRTRGNLLYTPFPGLAEKFRVSDGLKTGSSVVTTNEQLGYPYETMTDTADSPKIDHQVNHTRKTVSCWVGKTTHRSVPGLSGGVLSYYVGECVVPFQYYLQSQCGHLGATSGIKSLAIARVPAYGKAELEGFISLMEARELADTAAIKAAAALGQFAYQLGNAMTGSGLRKFVTREGKRALLRLRQAKPSDAKELFKALLTGVGFVNGASMEWKYGVRPMLDDIQKANAAVKRLGELRQRLLDGVRVYGSATESRQSSGVLDYSPLPVVAAGNGNFRFEYQKITKTTATASIVRRLNPTNPLYNVDWFNTLDVVMEVNGLTPSVKGLWNLLPLTFITDWFWNVSNLLESLETLSSPSGSSFTSTGGLYSLKTETTLTGSGQFLKEQNPTTRCGSATHSSYTRASDSLTGGPVLYIPPITLPTQAGKWWSIAQITLQQLLQRNR